jgi:hypothetical protein
MSRHIIPGTDKVIYCISKDQDEFDSDIEALEQILDATEEEIYKTRAALHIIKENKDAYISDTNHPTGKT